jgi:hypothetical protein
VDHELKLHANGWSVVVSYHPPHEPSELDGRYSRVHKLDPDPRAQPSSRHSVEVVDASGASSTCLLTSSGGASGVHEHSALLHRKRLVIAVGPYMCALSLTSLDLAWSVAVDDATCFGVYYSSKHDCYVSHGELSVARVSLEGAVIWSAGGKDIFSEGFVLHDDSAEAVDFNHERYRINLATGDSVILR